MQQQCFSRRARKMTYYLASCVGLMFILKYGTILQPMRNKLASMSDAFGELFNCALCLGVHVGIIHALFLFATATFNADYLLLPLLSAGICWFADIIMTILQYICAILKSIHSYILSTFLSKDLNTRRA